MVRSKISWNIFALLAILIFPSCAKNNSLQVDINEADNSNIKDECGLNKPSVSRNTEDSLANIGDGSDGNLYLASGEIMLLENMDYNFSDIKLDKGSTLTTSEYIGGELSTIHIRSTGSCDFLGDIALDNYQGNLYLICSNDINFGGDVIIGGSLSVNSVGEIVLENSNGNLNEGASITVGGSLSISSSSITNSQDFSEGSVTTINTDSPRIINEDGSIILSNATENDIVLNIESNLVNGGVVVISEASVETSCKSSKEEP